MSRRLPDRSPRPVGLDVVALVTGLLATAAALGLLWVSIGGTLHWDLIKVAAPLLLVVVGVVGLALSRNRS